MLETLFLDMRMSTLLVSADTIPTNRLEVTSCDILGLHKNDIHTLQTGAPRAQSPIAVIGAGSGLKESFLIPQDSGYQVFSSEGGYAAFAPQDAWTYQVLLHLRRQKNTSNISIDHVLSERGIVSIYQCLRDDYRAAPESPELTAAFEAWEKTPQNGTGTDSGTARLVNAIAQHAIEGNDILSRRTMALFIQLYGAEAGNLALKMFPYGGLYITGTLAANILPLLEKNGEKDGFLEAFLNKGRMRSFLEDVPVHIVLNLNASII